MTSRCERGKVLWQRDGPSPYSTCFEKSRKKNWRQWPAKEGGTLKKRAKRSLRSINPTREAGYCKKRRKSKKKEKIQILNKSSTMFHDEGETEEATIERETMKD